MTERLVTNGITLVEGVLDAFTTRLRASLPTKLATMYTEYDDDFVLPAPVAYYTPMNDTPSPLNVEYPSVLVVGSFVRNTPATEGMEGIGYGGDMALSYSVYVFPLCKAETEARLQTMLYRYAIAVVEVLLTPGALGAYECHLLSIDYQNPAVSSEDDLIRDIPIEFLVNSLETF